ncbi:ACP S-malonyltransferase [Streptomyces abyssalis]|uniref:Malonyl CoA-acyl carrier protein transacylase n=1 Tax=Streptomyces abyssalis TaxID=933944 RepID=A0A1E7JMW4_9ACTN|nr:ACP S-malonyltransferase [Streptomyces abyssalis]OEU87007.1 ACP S-malonyltransferase [Streptomyces abyssalis]OEU89608.1 ACP S-malonyltransferase [Streptomyces abyssalis]
MTADATPTAVVFPGQGTQKQGMGGPWQDCGSWPLVKEISEHVGTDLEELLLNADDEALRRTDRAQLAVFTVGVLAFHEAVAAGVLKTVAGYAGHSLGEYVAMHAAGALELGDAARLVAARGRAMRDAAEERPGAMGALIKADEETAESLTADARAAGHDVWVANLNSPGQAVVSGTADGIGHVADAAAVHGARLVRLPVGGAFHSPMMSAAATRLAGALASVPFADVHAPVAANVDGRLRTGAEAHWPELEMRQLTGPVLWERGVRSLHGELGCRRFLELGRGRTLSGMITRILPESTTASAGSPEELRALTSVRT